MIELLNSDDFDNEFYQDFKDSFNYLFEDIFKDGRTIVVEASNSNWRGQTGYKEVKDTDELLSTILDGNHFESCKIGYNGDNKIVPEGLIKSYGHDVPTGSSIVLMSVKNSALEKWDCTEVSPSSMKYIVYDRKSQKFKLSHLTVAGYYKRLNAKAK